MTGWKKRKFGGTVLQSNSFEIKKGVSKQVRVIGHGATKSTVVWFETNGIHRKYMHARDLASFFNKAGIHAPSVRKELLEIRKGNLFKVATQLRLLSSIFDTPEKQRAFIRAIRGSVFFQEIINFRNAKKVRPILEIFGYQKIIAAIQTYGTGIVYDTCMMCIRQRGTLEFLRQLTVTYSIYGIHNELVMQARRPTHLSRESDYEKNWQATKLAKTAEAVKHIKSNNLTFRVPDSAMELNLWGREMSNCIGSYKPHDNNPVLAVYENGKMKWNLEIRNKQLVQIQGKCQPYGEIRRNLELEETKVIKTLLKGCGLLI